MKPSIALSALLLLAACGSDETGNETVGKEIADDYQQAMDEAAAVEEQLRQQQQRVDQAIEEPQ
jgi:hypothetical protein